MRYMLIANATKDSESGAPPNPALMEGIAKFSEEAARAGVLVQSEGLYPSSMGAKIQLSGGKVTVIDGPFAETKELIAGFAIVQVKVKDEAVEWARRFWQVHADVLGPEYEGEGMILRVFDPADFAPAE